MMAAETGGVRALESRLIRQASQDTGGEPRFVYEAPYRRPYPCLIGCLRRHLFKAFIVVVFLGTAVWLAVDIATKLPAHQLIKHAKLFSVPLVSLLFTWFHVWLALQMMFYPIHFVGYPRRPIVPQWLDLPINGWQGIVPRKAGDMARRFCDKMIGNICTIEEFADRIEPAHFWDALQDVFSNVSAEVLKRIIETRWPALWAILPEEVRQELRLKVIEETRKAFLPAVDDMKRNINSILDIRQMATEALANEPQMMVDIFREVAARELGFITHVAAVMGFLLGLVQVGLYIAVYGVWQYTDYIMLPVSGLVIGYFTNFLALKMTFSPIWPHMMCGNYFNFQGVFLKRQKEAAEQMSKNVCEKVIDARAMIEYMMRSSSSNAGVDKVLAIYQRAINDGVDASLGRVAGICPSMVGREIERLKQDVVDISLEIIPRHTAVIENYMDVTMNVRQTLSYRLARVTPAEFEDIIHPIFKADEWILLCVGGFLGVVIGLLQAWALMAIQ